MVRNREQRIQCYSVIDFDVNIHVSFMIVLLIKLVKLIILIQLNNLHLLCAKLSELFSYSNMLKLKL